jgi:hypothetical protein
MNRRDFIWLVGGASGWPLAVRAQEVGKRPLVAVLTRYEPDEVSLSSFLKGLRE